ncbi:putative acyl-CoA synthetase [Tieghemostelium lacteum]|uniref:Putative acyl-CoA synthetase n=1 Tax=Tieghemostelium lacteum TaxID=361077 RepID=A0A151Z4R1_TIELA|nr:putative acyl-CoA synthetase [Tieghemostelium lacteum]|eukprot:KYQ88946.1 putative acyl-CoA synthetase [Tieghemostelium lacteum]
MISNKLGLVGKIIRNYSTSTLVQKGKFQVNTVETIGSRLEQITNKYEYSDAIGVPDHHNFTLTFRDLNHNVKGLASGFVESNMKPQEVVLTNLPQGSEYVISQIASSKAGLKFVSLNPQYTFDQIGEQLKSSNAKTLIIGDNNQRIMIEEARDYFPNLKTIRYSEYHRDSRFPALKYIYSTGTRQEPGIDLLKDIVLDADLLSKTKVSSTDTATLVENGQDLVAYTHSQLLNTGDSIIELLDLKPNQRVSLSVPLYIGSSFPFYLGCLTNGLYIGITSNVNSNTDILNTIAKDKCSILYVTPKTLEEITRSVDLSKFDLSTLKTLVVSGVPNQQILKEFEEKVKCSSVVLHYVDGQPSQLSGLCFNSQGVGRLLPNLEAKVVDSKGQVVQRGESGILQTKGFHVNNNNKSEWLDTKLNVKMNSDGTFTRI